MKSKKIKKTAPARNVSLKRVIKQSEKINEAVTRAASELTSVNEVLNQEKEVNLPGQSMHAAITQNEVVEHVVAKAAEDLKQVNLELTREVAERAAIEAELADAKTDLAEARDDLSKSQAKEEEARQIALQDALTGLPNRVFFEQRLKHGLIQAKRHGWGLAVLFLDVDNFKNINDTYGHDLGNKILLAVADRLQASVREEDTVCRWGGDEFVCLLLNIQSEAVLIHLAEKLVDRLSEACEVDGKVLAIRLSLGIATYPADGETVEALFNNADAAMYKAKGTGKRFVLFREVAFD
jgi:diguanylate cyclase (GGDEF)-like protein